MAIPVSYTHLDVYKRQFLDYFIPMSLEKIVSVEVPFGQVENCRTYGGHGEQMAVFASTAKVDGKPLTELIGTDALTKDQWGTANTP